MGEWSKVDGENKTRWSLWRWGYVLIPSVDREGRRGGRGLEEEERKKMMRNEGLKDYVWGVGKVACKMSVSPVDCMRIDQQGDLNRYNHTTGIDGGEDLALWAGGTRQGWWIIICPWEA